MHSISITYKERKILSHTANSFYRHNLLFIEWCCERGENMHSYDVSSRNNKIANVV